MTAPTTTPIEQAAFYARLQQLHGHRCPMSILGARLGLAARARVGRHGETGDVTARYHHRTCAIDGIQLALGTTAGNNNLELVPGQEHLLEAENLNTGARVALTLTDEALTLGREYGELLRSGGDRERMNAILAELERLDEALCAKGLGQIDLCHTPYRDQPREPIAAKTRGQAQGGALPCWTRR